MNPRPDIVLGRPSTRKKSAFTLIELLVVMAIMALLITLGGPSLLSVFKGSSVTQGGQLFQDQLSYYRQYALANNCPVEVHIYTYIDPGIPGDVGQYRAMQGFAITSSAGAATTVKTAIGRAVRLPSAVIIDRGRILSPLIALCAQGTGGNLPGYQATPAPQDPAPLPNLGTYSYVYFEFRQDGSSNFSLTGNGAWIYFMTIRPLGYGTGGLSQAAIKNKNYYTIQMDPLNGHIYFYRP